MLSTEAPLVLDLQCLDRRAHHNLHVLVIVAHHHPLISSSFNPLGGTPTVVDCWLGGALRPSPKNGKDGHHHPLKEGFQKKIVEFSTKCLTPRHETNSV